MSIGLAQGPRRGSSRTRTAAEWTEHRRSAPDIEDSDRVEVLVALSAKRRTAGVLKKIVGRLSLEPCITERWRVEPIES